VVQNTTRLLLDLDVVAHVLPLEDGGLAFDHGEVIGLVLDGDVAAGRGGLEVIGGLALLDSLVSATEH
jgi:hypothetical protein